MTLLPTLPHDLAARFAAHGAWFVDGGLDIDQALARGRTSALIAADVPAFERLRDGILGRQPAPVAGRDAAADRLAAALVSDHVLASVGGRLVPASPEAQRYLRGGWLEEHVGLAAQAAGADEVRIGQKIGWRAGGFDGENEIDTIARFGDRVVFVSAKALRTRLRDGDAEHRARLMDALQEADNLVDHFGDGRSAVALAVSTDLWNEARGEPRYEQLHGKAAALGVALVALEDLGRAALSARLAALGHGG